MRAHVHVCVLIKLSYANDTTHMLKIYEFMNSAHFSDKVLDNQLTFASSAGFCTLIHSFNDLSSQAYEPQASKRSG